MSARLSPNSGRFDRIHGDEDRPEVSAADARAIERRAAELIAERVADPAQFADLMSGIDLSAIDPHLQRALLNLDRARKGEQIAVDAVLSALHRVQKIVRAEAEMIWGEECGALAEIES